MDISIKSMSIDGHTFPVPHGLSELLNRAGAWSAAPISPLEGYRRKIKRVNGQLVTVLIYIGDAS